MDLLQSPKGTLRNFGRNRTWKNVFFTKRRARVATAQHDSCLKLYRSPHPHYWRDICAMECGLLCINLDDNRCSGSGDAYFHTGGYHLHIASQIIRRRGYSYIRYTGSSSGNSANDKGCLRLSSDGSLEWLASECPSHRVCAAVCEVD